MNQWSLSISKPSDLGFSDEKYILPELHENIHEVKNEANWLVNSQYALINVIAKNYERS
jgi:hypothetical protein